MVKTDGAPAQVLMQENPANKAYGQFFFPLRGSVIRVLFSDDSVNSTKQTLVDIKLFDGFPEVRNVPLAYPYIHEQNGVEETPVVGALVLVQFIAGNFARPVVTGFLSPPTQQILAKTSEAPRSHHKRNGTWKRVEKDGTERKYVKKDKVTVIEGQEQVTVNTGDITINVVQGKCTVTVKGKTAWRSDGTIELDGTAGTGVKGILQGDCIETLTGKPYPHISASVKASK